MAARRAARAAGACCLPGGARRRWTSWRGSRRRQKVRGVHQPATVCEAAWLAGCLAGWLAAAVPEAGAAWPAAVHHTRWHAQGAAPCILTRPPVRLCVCALSGEATKGLFGLPFMARAMEKRRQEAAQQAAAMLAQLDGEGGEAGGAAAEEDGGFGRLRVGGASAAAAAGSDDEDQVGWQGWPQSAGSSPAGPQSAGSSPAGPQGCASELALGASPAGARPAQEHTG